MRRRCLSHIIGPADARIQEVSRGAVICLAAFFLFSCLAFAAETKADVRKKTRELAGRKAEARARAAAALGRTRDKDASDALAGRFNREKDGTVRAHIAHSLGTTRAPDAVPVLLDAARKDPSPDVRSAACTSLGAIGDARAIDVLRQALLDTKENENVRVSAGNALIRFIDDAVAADAVAQAFREGGAVIRLGLVSGMRQAKHTEPGKEFLKTASGDADTEIADLAKELLKG